MVRRHITLAVAALAGTLLLAIEPAVAQDEPYPPTAPVFTVFPTTVVVGGSVTATGSGYSPGEDVQITVSTDVQAAPRFQESGPAELIAMVPVAAVSAQASQVVTAGGDGGFTTTVTLTQVGTATITATGMESGLSASAVVTVVASAAGLPQTGTIAPRLLAVGGGVVALGSALLLGLLLWRRRDRTRV